MKIPICDHIFHVHCLRKWLVDWQKCPTCEQNIIKLPEQQKQRYLRSIEEQMNAQEQARNSLSPKEHNQDFVNELNRRISEESKN